MKKTISPREWGDTKIGQIIADFSHFASIAPTLRRLEEFYQLSYFLESVRDSPLRQVQGELILRSFDPRIYPTEQVAIDTLLNDNPLQALRKQLIIVRTTDDRKQYIAISALNLHQIVVVTLEEVPHQPMPYSLCLT